jgi:hypothetical protein
MPGASLYGLATVSDRLYAVGAHGRAAGAWSSPDGVQWAPGSGLSSGWLMGIAGGPGGLVAVGCTPGTSAMPCGGPLVERSSDGLAWSPVRIPGSLGMLELDHVVYAFGRFFATGTSPKGSASAAFGTRVAVITSTDGRSWTRVSLPDDRAYMADAVAQTSGRLGVLGGPSVWWTADGNAWHKSALSAGGRTVMCPVPDGAAVVAVGWSSSAVSFLRTADLVHWSAVSTRGAPGGAYPSALVRTDTGYALAIVDAKNNPGILASTDGTSWRGVGPAALTGSPVGGIAFGGRLIVAVALTARDSAVLAYPLPVP